MTDADREAAHALLLEMWTAHIGTPCSHGVFWIGDLSTHSKQCDFISAAIAKVRVSAAREAEAATWRAAAKHCEDRRKFWRSHFEENPPRSRLANVARENREAESETLEADFKARAREAAPVTPEKGTP